MRMVFVSALFAALLGSVAQAGVLSPGLEAQMDRMADHEILKVLVVMKDQADVRALDLDLHDRAAPLAARHNSVVTTLRSVSQASQKNLIGDLRYREADKARGGVLGFTPHWIVNSVVLVAEAGVIREIAARDDVEVIEPDLEVELIEPVMVKTAGEKDQNAPQALNISPGVEMIGAPRVWDELGIDGTGTLVANLDSGVDGNHVLLADRWRGNFAPASECWRDYANAGSPNFPVDFHGHGTHTMGTITGGAGTEITGVAPGSQWIACNAVFNGGSRNEFDNAIIAAFEFFTDPDGNPATQDDVPDVVQNSWGVSPNPTFGYTACDSRWWDAIDNCEAAGVVVTWSAGNEGPTKGTIRSPGDRASSPTNCFTVGSVGYSIPYVVSEFSSRGPSGCGGEFAIKPEVVAPGEDILSTLPDNNFGYMSGTSMAGPHVAGLVALMRQANPDIDVIDVKQILMDTAIDFGSAGNDNASGYGMVDAYAAVWAALTDNATVEGVVTDAQTGLPLANVVVKRDGYVSTRTDAAGHYSVSLRTGRTELEFSDFSYYPTTSIVFMYSGDHRVNNVALSPRPTGTVSGTVYGPEDQPVPGATVYARDIPLPAAVTGADGYYELELPVFEDAAYEIVATAQDLAYVVENIGLPASRELDIHMPYIVGEGFESGTLTSFPWQSGGTVPMEVTFDEAQEGVFSVRSGDIRDEETSELSLVYTVVGGGDVSFYYKTECENGYDGLLFYIDGVFQGGWTGEWPWTRYTQPVAAGQHVFKWVYSKDYAVSYKRDAAWIDRIEFPGTGVAPEPRIQVDLDNLSMTFNSGWRDSVALNVANTGGYRLDYTTRISAFPANGPNDSAAKTADPAWATVNPATGWVHPGVSRDLQVTFNGTGMANGTYYAMLEIMSTDLGNPVTSVPLVFSVGGVSDVANPVLPTRVTLVGAVPNPFNPVTFVTYNLPLAGEVNLRIYDVSGRLVRDLVSGPRSAGQHQERWDGRDDAGLEAASGVYFAQLHATGQTEMKSMLLLR